MVHKMYLLKPSDLLAAASATTKVPPAPPVGEEKVIKTRLDMLDEQMRGILEKPEQDLHTKIRLYLEALRQYITSARQMERAIQEQPSPVQVIQQQPTGQRIMVDREKAVEDDVMGEDKPVQSKRGIEETLKPSPVKRPRAATGDEEEEWELAPNGTTPVPQSVFASSSSSSSTPAERPINPMRLSFYEVAEQAQHPFSIDSLVHLMPPSRKKDARKVLDEIENSKTMRWDTATGHVYRNDKPISSTVLIDSFLKKRFSTTEAAKGPMTGYDDFKAASQEARLNQKGEGPGGRRQRPMAWLKY